MATTKKRGTFPKGQSGNPAGRPVGSGEAAAWRAALAKDADKIIAVIVGKALAGDPASCALVLSRLVPPLKPSDPATAVKLGTGSLTMQARRLTKLMAAGDLPMTQGIDMVAALSTIAKMRSLDELSATVDLMKTELKGLRDAIAQNRNH